MKPRIVFRSRRFHGKRIYAAYVYDGGSIVLLTGFCDSIADCLNIICARWIHG